jgi:hypothetical protein
MLVVVQSLGTITATATAAITINIQVVQVVVVVVLVSVNTCHPPPHAYHQSLLYKRRWYYQVQVKISVNRRNQNKKVS